jgi:hypothetical protein
LIVKSLIPKVTGRDKYIQDLKEVLRPVISLGTVNVTVGNRKEGKKDWLPTRSLVQESNAERYNIIKETDNRSAQCLILSHGRSADKQ